MTLRSRLLMRTCLLAMMTGTGFVSAAAFAQSSAPVPLFLKQEAEQDAERQPDQVPGNLGTMSAPLSEEFGNTNSNNAQTETFTSDPNAVQSLSLGEVDAEAVGTIDRSRGGLGIDMWNGTSRRSAAKLISELPTIPATHAARDLQERMLLSTAALPQGSAEISLLQARVAKLIEMGSLDNAIELVRATPQGSRDSILAQAEVNALLISAQIDAACEAIDSYGASYEEIFWLKAAAMCAFYSNDPTSAAFSVDLVREMGGESDTTFFGLVSAIRSNSTADANLLDELRPLDLALLAIAKQSIPTNQLEIGNPAAIIGITNASASATDVRLEAARKAEKLGMISPEKLAEVYESVTFEADALANVLDDARESIQARQYAKLYQAAAKSDVPAARAEILAALFETADFEGDFIQAARLSAPLLADIPANGDFSWFAIPALKASIASNSLERAANWLQVAKSSANASNDISSRLSLLYPVLAMSGLEKTGAVQKSQTVTNAANGNVAQTFGSDAQSATQQTFGLGGAIVTDAPASSGGMASATVMPASTSPEDLQIASDRAAALARHRARMIEWQEMQAARGDQAAAKRYSELIFNLFEGFGIEVSDSAWDSLLTAPYAEERVTISSAVSHQLSTAAAALEKAKTVSLAIQAQQAAAADNADPKVLSESVTSLQALGLEHDARRLATELLLSRNQ